MVLMTDSLSLSFRNERGVSAVTHDVSISVGDSEIVALVGESGSGKSVTAMELAGLNPRNVHSTGRILFDGVDVLSLSHRARRELMRKDIGVIFQDPLSSLNPVYTIGASMGMAMRHRLKSRTQRRSRALELLELVNIPDPGRALDRYPHELSGGQRQRVMIAMAIESEPRLLIADEPTTALDVTVQADILDLIEDLKNRLEMSVLLITHDMGVVANSADRMYVMESGRICEEGAVETVFAHPGDEYTKKLFMAVPRLDTGRLSGASKGAAAAEKGDGVSRSAPEAQRGSDDAIRFEEVDYLYGESVKSNGRKALDGVSFGVARGALVGMVGESGSGKSTIGRIAVGLLRPSGGRMVVGQPKGRRFIRSMVFQDPASSLDPRRTIGESVAAPLLWGNEDVSRSEARRRARELLERVHLPGTWSDRRPHELSGGQKQRVGIARALSIDPDLLIADEPTSALDVSVQAAVLELFTELREDFAFACLFISHDLAVVEQVADDIIVLKNGRIEEAGRAAEIIYEPESAYTRRLIASAPVPDPVVQRERKMSRS